MGGPTQAGSIDESLIDLVADAQVTLDFEHHEQHEGDHYFIRSWVDVVGAAGFVTYLMFITPNTAKRVHARAGIQSEAEFNIEIYEDATVSDNGVAVPRYNNDRDSENISELLPYSGPTVTDDGTRIWGTKVGSGKDATVSPGINYEIIAKTNSIYLFKLTKIPATTHWIAFDFWWYEHTPSTVKT